MRSHFASASGVLVYERTVVGVVHHGHPCAEAGAAMANVRTITDTMTTAIFMFPS